MLSLESKTLSNYYGIKPDDYYIKYIHHNIDIIDDSFEEYKTIEKDLEKIYSYDNNSFLLYFSDVENYIKINNYINIHKLYKDKIYLRIRSREEYFKLKQFNKNDDIKIIVDLKDLDTLDIVDLNLIIQIDYIGELSLDTINQILKSYKVKEILLGQIPYLTKDDKDLYDIMSKMYNIDSSNYSVLEKINKITNDIYSLSDFLKIYKKFNDILNNMNIENKIDGFYKIFNYIANNVKYDNEGISVTKIENQNLIGPVFNNIGVCEGYSKYFSQLLSLIGIKSNIVQSGKTKSDGGHVWNQVLIDGKWYNADVTAASYSINHNEQIRTCLVSDNELLYKTNSSIANKCYENYENKNFGGK